MLKCFKQDTYHESEGMVTTEWVTKPNKIFESDQIQNNCRDFTCTSSSVRSVNEKPSIVIERLGANFDIPLFNDNEFSY